MVFTSQGIHQAPTMVYPWCHRVLPITTIELLVALLHNSCCLLCASINSRLGVTCSCKSLAQCAPLCWVAGCWRWHVSAPLLLGREEAPGLRISAPGHITPACLSSTLHYNETYFALLQQNQSNQLYCKCLGSTGNSSTQSSDWGRRRRTCKSLYLMILLPGKCRLSGYSLQTRTSLHYAVSVFPWKVIAVSDWFPKLNIPDAQNYFHLVKENKII